MPATTIYDLVTSKEIKVYYDTLGSNKVPYLGETLFPPNKQLGMKLEWIKGSKGLPVVLKPAALDTKSALRGRIGINLIETKMPFFKESMLIKEEDRQQLNMLMQSGNQPYIDGVMKLIFDDEMTLLDGATAQRERMRMQLLSTGRISIIANGENLDYDYQLQDKNKGDANTPWSDAENSTPIADIQEWQSAVEDATGTRPTRAICSGKTWGYLMANKSIKMSMNVLNGDKIILTDSMLEQYLLAMLGLTVQRYSKKFIDEKGAQQSFFPDGVFTLIPDGYLGTTWFGTTPEESDLMGDQTAQVSIVDTGVAITTTKQTDPVNVNTKVTMVTLPSFERIDEIFIADIE